MDPLLFLPLNLNEEQLEEFQSDDDTAFWTPYQLEDDEQDFEIVVTICQSELDQRCRMCADKHENMKQVFSTEAMELSLPFKMEKYVNITVSKEDHLPLQVCVSCEAKLEMSVALAESCADAQTFLNNLLASSNTERPDSPVAASPPANPEMLADNFSDNSEDAFPEPLENLPTTSDPIEEQQIEELINIGKDSKKPDAFVYFVCKKCSVPFDDMDGLENHYKNEHMVFLCRKGCDLIFNSSTELNEHHKQAHEPNQDKVVTVVHYLCNENELVKLANERSKEPNKLEAQDLLPLVNGSHKKKPVGRKVYKLICPICDKIYTTKFLLKRHILRHGGLRNAECPVCHKWMDVDILRRHKETHNSKQFVCDVCQRKFSCKRYLSLHLRVVHMKEWFYECKICNKKHKNILNIKKHIKTHKSSASTMDSKCYIRKSNFQCTICNTYSANEKCLKLHLLQHRRIAKNGNIDQLNFQCEICAKMYKTKKGLDLHLQGFHRGEKPLQCQYCPSRFLEERSLQTHEMKHEGIFEFKCHLCPRSFVRNAVLKDHIRRMHLDLRPYSCTYCVKTFQKGYDLKVHTRTHTGEKPFICKVCNRGFSQKHDMLKHEVSHSNEFLYNCKTCKFGSNRLKDLTEHTCNESVQS